MLSVTDFDPKGTISEVRVHAGLYLDILEADRSPNAVRFHVGTTQVDFEVDRLPPANSPPADHLITMVKETVILHKKVSKMKKVVSLIDLKVMKTRNPRTVMAAMEAILELLKNCSFPNEVLTDKILACVRQNKLGIVPVARFAKEALNLESLDSETFGTTVESHVRAMVDMARRNDDTVYVFQQPFSNNW